MDYKDSATGEVMTIAYSQELQKQDIKWKKIMVAVMVFGVLVLVLILALLVMLQFKGNHLGYILQNLICKQYTYG